MVDQNEKLAASYDCQFKSLERKRNAGYCFRSRVITRLSHDIYPEIFRYDSAKVFHGCKLTSIKPGSIYSKLGLKVGDVVNPNSNVEAKSLGSPKQVLDEKHALGKDCREGHLKSGKPCDINDLYE